MEPRIIVRGTLPTRMWGDVRPHDPLCPLLPAAGMNPSKEERQIRRNCWVAFLMVLLISLISIGCSSNVKERREKASKAPIWSGQYYFFDDILIPKELSYDEDDPLSMRHLHSRQDPWSFEVGDWTRILWLISSRIT